MPRLHGITAKVRVKRARRRWRQADLGQRMHWSVSQGSDLESGRRAVHAGDLPVLCAEIPGRT